MNLKSILVLGIVCCWPLTVGAEDPIFVGHAKQLFVDDFIVSERSNVQFELGEVEKANEGTPIFTDGWFYGTVLHDDERFKLWYRKPNSGGFGYAESHDGLTFKRMDDVRGINFAGDYTLAVELNSDNIDPNHRYLAAYDAPGMAAGIAYSADGIDWTCYNNGQPVTGRAADTYNQILWDDSAQLYRLFTRTDFGSPGGAGELRGTRSMTNPDIMSSPAAWQLVREWAFDRERAREAQRRQIYALTCWPYEGVYFALLSMYEYPGDVSEGQMTDHQKRHERDVMNFYIATSRDADNWDLRWVYAGRPMIPRGLDGSFDKDLLLPASTIVTHDDKHWLYYAGANERHGSGEVRFDRDHAIGLATLRLDGFVALQAGTKWGTVVTKPFRLDGTRLNLNLAAPRGEVRVEVLDESGKEFPKYSGRNAAEGNHLDQLRWQPSWRDSDALTELQGKIVRLRFQLRDAKLYSFQVL